MTENTDKSHRMFEDVVKPRPAVGGRRSCSLPLSIGVHTVILAALLVLPIVAPGVLPAPPTVLAFIAGPSSPPPPPPPPSAPRAPEKQTQGSESKPSAAPLVAPSTVSPERDTPSPFPPQPVVDNVVGVAPGFSVGTTTPPPPPPPTPAPTSPVRAGGDIKPPLKTKDVRPVYPAIAQAARVEGLVIIEATIAPNGRVQDARVLRSSPLLEAAALEAVRQWEFTPTLLNGTPVPVIVTVTVDFRLR